MADTLRSCGVKGTAVLACSFAQTPRFRRTSRSKAATNSTVEAHASSSVSTAADALPVIRTRGAGTFARLTSRMRTACRRKHTLSIRALAPYSTTEAPATAAKETVASA